MPLRSPEIPAFLLLHLRSIDDDGGLLSWRGPVGGQQPLAALLTLAYTDQLARLQKLTIIELQLGLGYSRQFALLSIEPAPTADHVDLSLFDLTDIEPAEPQTSSFSHTIEFEGSPKMAADINRLFERISLHSNTQQVALRSGQRYTSN
jgi:hypothetical protein